MATSAPHWVRDEADKENEGSPKPHPKKCLCFACPEAWKDLPPEVLPLPLYWEIWDIPDNLNHEDVPEDETAPPGWLTMDHWITYSQNWQKWIQYKQNCLRALEQEEFTFLALMSESQNLPRSYTPAHIIYLFKERIRFDLYYLQMMSFEELEELHQEWLEHSHSTNTVFPKELHEQLTQEATSIIDIWIDASDAKYPAPSGGLTLQERYCYPCSQEFSYLKTPVGVALQWHLKFKALHRKYLAEAGKDLQALISEVYHFPLDEGS